MARFGGEISVPRCRLGEESQCHSAGLVERFGIGYVGIVMFWERMDGGFIYSSFLDMQ